GTIIDQPLISIFMQLNSWKNYRARTHRLRLLEQLPQTPPLHRLPPSCWKAFWSKPQHLSARTIWCRLLLGKLYCQASMSRFNPSISRLCKFCLTEEESLGHLFVTCPFKWDIWIHVFALYLPDRSLSSDKVLRWLFHLQFSPIDPSDITAWLVCSCLIQVIWRHHWAYIINDQPFSPPTILSS
ncbi:hypothetical protein BC941DRAFT_340157, partial [Chlamydoabsidia padenii]